MYKAMEGEWEGGEWELGGKRRVIDRRGRALDKVVGGYHQRTLYTHTYESVAMNPLLCIINVS